MVSVESDPVTAVCHTTTSPTPWKAKKQSNQVSFPFSPLSPFSLCPLCLLTLKNIRFGIVLMTVVGPIAHTVADLRFLFKTIVAAEPWFSDPKCIEFPWRQERADKIKNRKLTFGIIKWDGLVMPHPPVQRGVRIVQEALKAQGHEIIEFDVPDATTANSLTVPHLPPFLPNFPPILPRFLFPFYFQGDTLIQGTNLLRRWRKRHPRRSSPIRRTHHPQHRSRSPSRSTRRDHQRSMGPATSKNGIPKESTPSME
jgi:hypothetical protein